MTMLWTRTQMGTDAVSRITADEIWQSALRPTRMLAAATIATLASFAAANQASASDPSLDDVPSYILNAPLSIAARPQAEPAAAQPAQPQTETLPAESPDTSDSLRGALAELTESDQLDLSSDRVDPVDQVANSSLFADRKTSLTEGRFQLPPIEALTTGTDKIGNGEVPLGFRQGDASPMIPLPESGIQRGLPWQWTAHHWAAANTFSHPLYFEDRMLERHGHQRHPLCQHLASGGRFAAQALMLPYLAAINPPSECQYTLGYYRAGSCVPAFLQRPPYQRKAVLSQVTGIGTGIAILP